MAIKDILLDGGGILLLLLTLIQIVPIKLNPWSWLAKKIGETMNADVMKKLNQMENKLSYLEKRMEGHITMDDRRVADSHRARILHFNNELLRNIGHSREEFLETLAEIDSYEEYCDAHPEYPNNRATLAIKNIKSNYMKRQEEHDFLQ